MRYAVMHPSRNGDVLGIISESGNGDPCVAIIANQLKRGVSPIAAKYLVCAPVRSNGTLEGAEKSCTRLGRLFWSKR